MSTTRTEPKERPRRGGANVGVVVSLSIFAIAVLAVAFGMGGGNDDGAPAGAAQEPETIAGLEATGDVSAMGFPIVEVPGSATGSASVAGVTVEGANWEMGQVPLDIAVRPYWTLTNTGAKPVTLGEPQAEVRAGCCPGPFVMERSELAPGESTTLTFELGMSAGMDGWHDMGVYVPVQGSGGSEVLALSVTGDFRN